MQALSIMVAVLVGRPLTAQAQPGFLDPTGEFEVGRLEIDITDASRDEVFTEDPADKRRLLVTVYYPAVAADGALSALYGTPELAAALPFFDNERRGWVSSAYVDVPVADGRFPVLVFSPGLDSSTLFYTSLLSELASRGFVVAALWHPYSADVVAFPDGAVLRSNPAGGLGGSSPDQQAVQLTRLGEIWVADQRFVLDQLAVWNEQHALLRGRLDLQRVGALGHSLGGAAAVEAARIDERIDAAINMDGGMFGGVVTDGSRVPFLLIHSEVPAPMDAELQQLGITREQADALLESIMDQRAAILAQSRGARAETLEGATHNAFMTDFLFYSKSMPAGVRTSLIGDVDPEEAFGDISRWIAQFMIEHVAQTQAALQPMDSVRAAALREADRFAGCVNSIDVDCLVELTDEERLEASGWVPGDYDTRSSWEISRRLFQNAPGDHYRRMEVALPWPTVAVDSELFTFVPYFFTFGEQSSGSRVDATGYLIGVSEDDGESWRFIPVYDYYPQAPESLNRVVPGYGDRPTPQLLRLEVPESPFESSRWLATTERSFRAADDGYVYSLTLEIRREIESQIDLTVQYDNPVHRDQHYRFHGSLEPGQRELKWQSPVLRNFETGETYEVVIEGRNLETGRLLFEHRQGLVFQPTRELWLSVVSEPVTP